jgi:hypothetical protein
MTDAIRALREAVERVAPPKEIAPLIYAAVADEGRQDLVCKVMDGGIEAMGAALAIMKAVLPGWRWNAGEDEHSVWAIVSSRHGTFRDDGAASPARALLLAILKALEAKNG